MEEVIEKLIEIKNKRTHCQCSRAKLVEKAYFERLETSLRALPKDSDKQTVLDYLIAEKSAVAITNDDLRIRAQTFDYAIALVKRIYG